MSYSLTIEVPAVPKSMNKSLRAGMFANRRETAQWESVIHGLTIGKKPPKPLELADVKFMRFAPRTLDFDGFVGSLKPVMDAIVRAGILIDDSWEVTGAWKVDQVKWTKSHGSPCLVISIHERDA